MARGLAALAMAAVLAALPAAAADHAISAKKLVVVDRLAASGKAKMAFLAKDPGVTKGAGTDRAAVEATLDVAFDGVHGTFLLPQGDGWVANNAKVAKYVSTGAPAGGAVSVGVVKDGTLARVVAHSLGDVPLDVSSPPSDVVSVALTVVNGGETNRHCTQFGACVHKAVAHGTGHKLVCRGGAPDATCAAVPVSTTTPSTVVTTTVVTTTVVSTTVVTTTMVSDTTSTTVAPPPVAYSVDCCQGDGQCAAGLGFSLDFYLYNWCQTTLPGSTGVHGGACDLDGTCKIAGFPSRTICCQTSSGCYDGAPVDNTASVWSFRNYCVGANLGTAYYDAVCDIASGACLPE